MSVAVIAGLAVAGGAGSVTRFVVDSALTARHPSPFPIATLVINVTGSLLLGVLTGLVLFHGAADAWRVVWGTGFCGGFTTFSTASWASVQLVRTGRPELAALNVLGSLALTTAAAVLGLAVSAL